MSSDMTHGRFDVHAHILPGVDDGCESVADSLACARLLMENGYRRLTCTPHVWPGFPENTWPHILEWTASLQATFNSEGLPLRLYPGGEVNIQAMWPALRDWGPEDTPTLAGAGTHVLVDFWAERMPPEVDAAVDHLQSRGFTVIMAHPERIGAFHRNPGLMDGLAARGVRFQGNLQCFQDPLDSLSRLFVEQFALEQRYFLLGSDCHRPDTLGLRMNGLKAALALLGQAKVDELTIRNPAGLLPKNN